MRFSTKTIHAGQKPDTGTGSVVVPIYQTSTYKMDELSINKGFEYSRSGNPTRQALEECLASIEGGKAGLAFSSGLAAEHAVLSVLRPGDHIVATEDMYGGTYRLLEEVFRPYGIRISYVSGNIPVEAAARHAIQKGGERNTGGILADSLYKLIKVKP
jgi:cystathionine gamma-lyase